MAPSPDRGPLLHPRCEAFLHNRQFSNDRQRTRKCFHMNIRKPSHDRRGLPVTPSMLVISRRGHVTSENNPIPEAPGIGRLSIVPYYSMSCIHCFFPRLPCAETQSLFVELFHNAHTLSCSQLRLRSQPSCHRCLVYVLLVTIVHDSADLLGLSIATEIQRVLRVGNA